MAKKKGVVVDGKTLEERLEQMTRKFGQSIIQPLSRATIKRLEVISTGCLALDQITEGGGFPRTCFSEIWGRQSIGKTSLLSSCAAELSELGGSTVLIDMEHKLQTDYFKECVEAAGGVAAYITQIKPATGRDCLESVLDLIGFADLIIIDSIAAVVTTAQMDAGDVEDKFWAAQARLITEFVQRVRPKLGVCGPHNPLMPVATAIVGINQVRADMEAKGGDKLKASGAWAWRHALSLQIKLTGGSVKVGFDGLPAWIEVNSWVRKNVIGRPDRRATFGIRFGVGIDPAMDVIQVGTELGVIVKKGSHYYLPDETKLGQGVDRVAEVLTAQPKLLAQLRQETAERIRNEALVSSEEAPQEV